MEVRYSFTQIEEIKPNETDLTNQIFFFLSLKCIDSHVHLLEIIKWSDKIKLTVFIANNGKFIYWSFAKKMIKNWAWPKPRKTYRIRNEMNCELLRVKYFDPLRFTLRAKKNVSEFRETM